MNKKGFTLIELIAVLIILTVITAMIMPNVVKYIDKNREESALSIEKLLIHNLELYNTDKEKDLWNENTECINVDINDFDAIKTISNLIRDDNYIKGKVSVAEDAEDLCSEVFTKIYENLEKYELGVSLRICATRWSSTFASTKSLR